MPGTSSCGLNGCQQVGAALCGSCSLVGYCSRDHQKRDWKQRHKHECKVYEVQESREWGRYLTATKARDLKQGQKILTSAPCVLGPRLQGPSPTCLGCLRGLGRNDPTNFTTILEPQHPEIVNFYVVQEGRTTDYEAPKL